MDLRLLASRFLGLSRFVGFRDPTSSRFSRSPYKGGRNESLKSEKVILVCIHHLQTLAAKFH